MIRRLLVSGLGPHDSTDLALNFKGTTTITGPSEAGKSTLMDAVCYTLWGQGRDGKTLPVSAMSADALTVSVELFDGTTLARQLSLTKGGARKVERMKVDRTGWEAPDLTTETAWRKSLGPLGARPKEARLVMVPFAWRKLATSEGNGRRLRNLLAGFGERGKLEPVVDELMQAAGFELRADPLSEKPAVARRRKHNAEMQRQQGRVETLDAGVSAAESAPPPTVTEAAAEQHRQVLADWEAWRAHDAAKERNEEQVAAWRLAHEEAVEWDKRRAELGDCPEVPEVDLERADEGLRTERAHLQALRDQRSELALVERSARRSMEQLAKQVVKVPEAVEQSVRQAEAEVEQLHAALESTTDVCPTCGRDGWADARESALTAYQAAEAAANEARVAKTEAAAQLAQQKSADIWEARDAAEKARHRLDKVNDSIEKQHAIIERHEAERVAALQAQGPKTAWEMGVRMLGDRPRMPQVTAKAPDEPERARPTEVRATEARARLRERERTAGRAEQRGSSLDSLRHQLVNARSRLDELRREGARLDALVEAVRAAPSVLLRRQVADVLGDTGPLSLEFPASGGVDVLVDGRAWSLASTGRQIVADVHLRAALRRALRMPFLPLFVDQVQDVAGQPLPTPAPCILLRTTDADALEAS